MKPTAYNDLTKGSKARLIFDLISWSAFGVLLFFTLSLAGV